MEIVPIDDKARSVPKLIKTLCGTCRYFAADCGKTEKETKVKGGYLIVTICDGYQEEKLTTNVVKRVSTATGSSSSHSGG